MKRLALAGIFLAIMAGCAVRPLVTVQFPPTYVVVETHPDLEVLVINNDGNRPYPNAHIRVRQGGDQGVTNSEGLTRLFVPADAEWVEIAVEWTNNCGDTFTYYEWPHLLRSVARHVVHVDTRCVR